MTAPALRSPLSERDFLRQVTELAEIRGWAWLHLRPGMTRDSWRTPISGPLGKGWVDLVLIRPYSEDMEPYTGARLLFVELKAEGGKLSPDQERVHTILRTLEQHGYEGTEVYVWYPGDWPEIEKVLK